MKSFELYDLGCLGCSNTSGLYVADELYDKQEHYATCSYGLWNSPDFKKCYEWVNQRTSSKCH